MSRMSRVFGIDGIDVAIQAGLTLAVIAFGSSFLSHGAAEAMIAGVSGVSLLVLGIRRTAALKRGRAEEGLGGVAGERLADLEARMADLEQAQYRLQELEERVDFAERLLAQAGEPERLS